MSRSRYSKDGHPDKEWWGKRPLAHSPISKKAGTNKWFKKYLHKIERGINKIIIKEERNGN